MRLLKIPKHLFSDSPSFRGYSHLETLRAEDLNLSITRLIHQKSGAMIYNLKGNDKDNTFAPIVKTLPENSTGCPHILEHLACCGSHKFPVRDPFFNMLRRSVNTYMNAWTGEDFTAYPFSSANNKDFENLYKVYLDMCLKPLLNELDFRQEGWRYELNPQTKQKQIKGIVFNEMKGAYQNPDRQLYIEMADKLFANTPYGYDSGGKPEQIVKLSYEQVQNMHSYYYHPSNMSFFYYGDADIKHKLEFLEDEYLLKFNYSNNIKQYSQKSKKLLQNMPSRMQKIFHQVNSYTAETPNLGLTYNLGLLQNTDGVDITCLNILSYLLFDSNQALLYQQFIEANLADSFGSSGFNLSSLLSFGVTLKNIKITSEQTLQRVQRCLQGIITNGIDQQRLQEYVRKTQLDILTPKQTQGIVYLSHSLPYMTNRLPLTNLTNLRSNLNAAVKKLKDKAQLKQFIHKYFLDNSRKLVIRQEPIQNKSQDPYKNIVGLQMPEEIIIKQQQQLEARQQNKQNLTECLPNLSISDLIASKQKQYQVKKEGKTKQGNNLSQIHVGIDVKGINFLRVIFKLNMQTPENKKLLPYLDIWKYTIKQGIAVKGLTNKELSSQLNLCSNDFDVNIEKSSSKTQPTSVNIIFSASCLNKYLGLYLSLLNRIVYEPQFKEEDILSIFRSYKSEKVQQLLDGGAMQHCLDYGSSMLNQQAKIFNRYYLTTEGIKITENRQVPSQFSEIHNKLRTSSDIIVMQHTNEYCENASQLLGFSYASTGSSLRKAFSPQLNSTSREFNQAISVTNAYDVNFCSQQYLGPEFFSKQHAEILLLIQLLEQDFLHKKIREKGGAYGARAVFRDVGTIALYSYMDPYSTETYAAFDQSLKQVFDTSVSKERLEQLKIKIIGGFESPIVPQRECVNRILKNFTIQQRSRFIEFIRLAEWSEVTKTGRKYLLTEQKSRVMFGKDVPQGFSQQKLKIPKLQKVQESSQGISK